MGGSISFHSFEYSKLLRDFSACVCHLLSEFDFVIKCDVNYFKIFIDGNGSVFAVEFRRNGCISLLLYNCFCVNSVLLVLFIDFCEIRLH